MGRRERDWLWRRGGKENWDLHETNKQILINVKAKKKQLNIKK